MAANTKGQVVFDRPDLGDGFQRYATSTGLYEEAQILSITGPEDHPERWTATVMTRNGIEFISSSVEFRTKYDWVPVAWSWDEMHTVWFNGQEEDEVASLEDLSIPQPKLSEKYMAWRARVYREHPELRGNTASAPLLSGVWKSREVEAASAK